MKVTAEVLPSYWLFHIRGHRWAGDVDDRASSLIHCVRYKIDADCRFKIYIKKRSYLDTFLYSGTGFVSVSPNLFVPAGDVILLEFRPCIHGGAIHGSVILDRQIIEL